MFFRRSGMNIMCFVFMSGLWFFEGIFASVGVFLVD